jgi:hypothetical protein
VGSVSDGFVKPAGYDALLATEKYAQLILEGAYVDTKFGTSSFAPGDHYELEPVRIYASLLKLQDLEPQAMLLRKVSLTVSQLLKHKLLTKEGVW